MPQWKVEYLFRSLGYTAVKQSRERRSWAYGKNYSAPRHASAAPTASQAGYIPVLRNADATIVHRRFESPFKIGDRIGDRYEVRRILGGGMGLVYVVYDHEARNVLAPKILALKTFQDPSWQNFSEQHALERRSRMKLQPGSLLMTTSPSSKQRQCKSFIGASSSPWNLSRPMTADGTRSGTSWSATLCLWSKSCAGAPNSATAWNMPLAKGVVPSGHQARQHPDQRLLQRPSFTRDHSGRRDDHHRICKDHRLRLGEALDRSVEMEWAKNLAVITQRDAEGARLPCYA